MGRLLPGCTLLQTIITRRAGVGFIKPKGRPSIPDKGYAKCVQEDNLGDKEVTRVGDVEEEITHVGDFGEKWTPNAVAPPVP